MFKFKTATINGKKYLLKINGETAEVIAVEHQNKFKTTISLPNVNYKDIIQICKDATKDDLEKLGYLTNKNSSLQLINTDIRVDSSFILEEQSYIEDIDVIKSLIEAAYDKRKGLVIFENNGEIQKHLKNKNVEFELYNKVNLKIKFADLNEHILLDTLSLSNREKSVIASFLNYKELNKANADINIPVLDGSNWLYDLFIVEPSTLAQQFKVSEYNIKMLKTSMLQLRANGLLSQDSSNINDIIQKVHNGNIIVIDVPDEDKKLIKATLANKTKLSITVIDNKYNKYDKIQYLLYNSNLSENVSREFKSFVLNKNSFKLQSELIGMQYYLKELKYLDFEYLLIKGKSFPIIVTNEDYKKNKVSEKIKLNTTSTGGFF